MPRRPLNETQEERFKRVALARANAVLEKLRLLGNCSNKRIYHYSDEEVNRIFSAINKQAKLARDKFNITKEERIEL